MLLLDAHLASSKATAYIMEPGLTPEAHRATFKVSQKFIEAKIPLYCSFSGAAEAIAKVIRYNEIRKLRLQQT